MYITIKEKRKDRSCTKHNKEIMSSRMHSKTEKTSSAQENDHESAQNRTECKAAEISYVHSEQDIHSRMSIRRQKRQRAQGKARELLNTQGRNASGQSAERRCQKWHSAEGRYGGRVHMEEHERR